MTHREKLEKFNKNLNKLPEHFDIPKVGPGWYFIFLFCWVSFFIRAKLNSILIGIYYFYSYCYENFYDYYFKYSMLLIYDKHTIKTKILNS